MTYWHVVQHIKIVAQRLDKLYLSEKLFNHLIYTIMETLSINGILYEFMPELEGGYYDALCGWHRIKEGRNVYNIDEDGRLFFNTI